VQEGADALRDTFCMLWPPRTDALPVPEQSGVACACRLRLRRARRRWTAERFPVPSTWDGPAMTERDETRRPVGDPHPKELHRRLKLYCVTHEIDVQDFVTEAIEEKLGRKPRPKKGTA